MLDGMIFFRIKLVLHCFFQALITINSTL
jgi:hypothetical protein